MRHQDVLYGGSTSEQHTCVSLRLVGMALLSGVCIVTDEERASQCASSDSEARRRTHTNTDIRVLPRCSVERSRVFTLVQGFVQKYARRVCKVGNVHARFLSPRDRNIAWLRDDIGWAAVAGGHFISHQPNIWLMFFLCQRRREHALCSASLSRYGVRMRVLRRGSRSGEIGMHFRMRIHIVQQWLGGKRDRHTDR